VADVSTIDGPDRPVNYPITARWIRSVLSISPTVP
jgi:hypothetical protein